MNGGLATWSVAAALVILAGAWLRLQGLTHMEFKRDEQDALVLAMRLVEGQAWRSPQNWPTHGMLSSNGVANAPLFSWLVAAVWAITPSPTAVAAAVAVINVLCLYPLWRWARRHMDDQRALFTLSLIAVSPFAVMFSRKIWTQDLLLPGALCVLWGIEWLRNDRGWQAIIAFSAAVLLAGQLHQSGPIALALLPAAIAAQLVVDRRHGRRATGFGAPSPLESGVLALALTLNLFFWLPYLRYLAEHAPAALANRPHLDAVGPVLLWKLMLQVVPFDLFTFFEPDRADFLSSRTRAAFYYAAIVLGAPLFVTGLWRWLRAPLSIPVLGLWWWSVIAAFALARIPVHPFYALILAPLPALLAAGAFDAPTSTTWLTRVRSWWRAGYVVAMLGLTITTQAWLAERGGSRGDYGVTYHQRALQAAAIATVLASPSTPGQRASTSPDASHLACGAVPAQVAWLVHRLDRRYFEIPETIQLCDNWVHVDGRLGYRWTIRH